MAVVDDDPSVRSAVGRLLRAAGYSVTTHASGNEFLSSLGNSQPACVVIDLHMPGLSGFDLLQVLGERFERMPAIVLTADRDPRIQPAVMEKGAAACLRKPLEDTTLLDAIAAVLQRHSLPRGAVNGNAVT
jgi:FixJ family two-component response regulator